MKNLIKSGIIALVLVLFFSVNKGYSQIAGIGRLIAAGTADAQVLLQPYITPAVNAFGAGLGSGWYNTAETHELGGVDFTVTINTGIISKKYETFEIDNAELSLIKLDNPSENSASTVAGPNESGPQMLYNFEGYTQPAFRMPSGMNSNYIPSPMVQVGIGLIKGTELMVRFFPNIKISDNEIGLWGLGGKHDIKQWIPGLKTLPVFNMSLMYGYTKLHTFVTLDIAPDDIGAAGLPGADGSEWDNQEFKLFVKSQTANLLFSANLPVVCFYGGVGFVTTKTNLKLEGEYPSVYLDEITPSVQVLEDPVDMEIKNQDGGITKPRFNAGIRFKLAVVTIHFDYSWANYSVLTGGLGLSFR